MPRIGRLFESWPIPFAHRSVIRTTATPIDPSINCRTSLMRTGGCTHMPHSASVHEE